MTDISIMAGLAALAAGWQYVNTFVERVKGLVLESLDAQFTLGGFVEGFLYHHGKTWTWGGKEAECYSFFVRPLKRHSMVACYTGTKAPVLVWWRGRLLMMSWAIPEGKGPGGPTLRVTALRGQLRAEELIEEATNFAAPVDFGGTFTALDKPKYRYRVRVCHGACLNLTKTTDDSGAAGQAPAPTNTTGSLVFRDMCRYIRWKAEELGAPSEPAPFDFYQLCSVSQACVDDFRAWLKLRDWYQARRIPHRRGHLLYGPPGTGKSSLVRAIAQDADLPVYVYDLATFGNADFARQWKVMQADAPCIALLEDFDTVFKGRENCSAASNAMGFQPLTFDCLLNCISGVEATDGIYLVITTNDPESLDPALCEIAKDGSTSRPGRIDRAFCLPLPDAGMRRRILANIMAAVTDADLQATEGMTATQVTEFGVSRALASVWSEQSPIP